MSQEDDFDWSANPSWSEVFEDENNFPIEPKLNWIPRPHHFRRIGGSPHEGVPLARIPEDRDEPTVETETEEDTRAVVKRSQSCSGLDAGSASIAIPNTESAMHRHPHQHVVPGSVPMQFSSSLPKPEKPLQMEASPVHDTNAAPVLARSSWTKVVISESLLAPPLLRSHGESPPRSRDNIKDQPAWAQPPMEVACVRGTWEAMTHDYRAMVLKEFGNVLFNQRQGWWQELLKSDTGRIVVKTDAHHYTVICYLPGLTPENLSIHHHDCSVVHIQANCHIRDDHFHWKVDLPGAVLEVNSFTARFVGATCTVQVPRRKYRRLLDKDTTEPKRRLVDNVDIVPPAIYEPT